MKPSEAIVFYMYIKIVSCPQMLEEGNWNSLEQYTTKIEMVKVITPLGG